MKTCIPQPLILLIDSNHLAITVGMASFRISWSACLSLLNDAVLPLDIIPSDHRICPIHKGEYTTEPGGCKPIRLRCKQWVYLKSFVFKMRCSRVRQPSWPRMPAQMDDRGQSNLSNVQSSNQLLQSGSQSRPRALHALEYHIRTWISCWKNLLQSSSSEFGLLSAELT